jgi:hypothetical protein
MRQNLTLICIPIPAHRFIIDNKEKSG